MAQRVNDSEPPPTAASALRSVGKAKEGVMTDRPVLIVGAGPTGLVLALWLTRLGIKVRIIDKTAEAGTTSRALAVQARTLEFYHQVGLDEAVIAGGAKIEKINLWVSGHRAAQVALRRIGEGLTPYAFALVYPQDAHERLLIERLAALGVRVERQTELLRFSQHDGNVTATLRRPDSSEEVCEAKYIAGCDGASSTVRQQLGVGFPGGTYTGLFYVADVEGTGEVVHGDLHADIEDADFLLLFPLRGNGHWRLVGTVLDFPQGEHGKLSFDDVKGKAVEHLKLKIEKVNWFSTYRVHHRVADRFRDRRAFLLGDAAHVHSPVGGQGMNTGIKDAYNLAWKLALVVSGRARAALVHSYEDERLPVANHLLKRTDRLFSIVVSDSWLVGLFRTRVMPKIMGLALRTAAVQRIFFRSEEHTSELQSHLNLVC